MKIRIFDAIIPITEEIKVMRPTIIAINGKMYKCFMDIECRNMLNETLETILNQKPPVKKQRTSAKEERKRKQDLLLKIERYENQSHYDNEMEETNSKRH